ncbi:hypothetical protein AVEN_151726-1 [Araneus ventricosus]|uniref:Uncharacterized protein n=1 Tax=Araneus ventricosus TaxID=182803 RepID=A0A4Y2DPQ0_ARAVE|nr:hypothetical protein AVEN_151726-1 [Araneus ventricosus]
MIVQSLKKNIIKSLNVSMIRLYASDHLGLLCDDNAPVRRSLLVSNYLSKRHFSVLLQPAYSSDIDAFSSDEDFLLSKEVRRAAKKALEDVAKERLHLHLCMNSNKNA